MTWNNLNLQPDNRTASPKPFDGNAAGPFARLAQVICHFTALSRMWCHERPIKGQDLLRWSRIVPLLPSRHQRRHVRRKLQLSQSVVNRTARKDFSAHVTRIMSLRILPVMHIFGRGQQQESSSLVMQLSVLLALFVQPSFMCTPRRFSVRLVFGSSMFPLPAFLIHLCAVNSFFDVCLYATVSSGIDRTRPVPLQRTTVTHMWRRI